jgi:hypothetical protein
VSKRRDRRRIARRRGIVIAGALVALEAVAMRACGYRMGRNVVVRCRQGHLYTTIWLPGGSLKALRLGLRRLQRCPVGRHWSIVTPVREAELSEAQIQLAHEHHDIRIP